MLKHISLHSIVIPFVERIPENIIQQFVKNDVTYKFGTDILKEINNFKNLIQKKLPDYEKLHFCHLKLVTIKNLQRKAIQLSLVDLKNKI